jgi:hypothetical protein
LDKADNAGIPANIFHPRTFPKQIGMQTIAQYGHSNLRKSLWQLLDMFIPYCVVWALMLHTVQREYPFLPTIFQPGCGAVRG